MLISNLCCLAGYGISGKAQLLAGWLGLEPGDAKAR
jgi:hypothetical protein